MGDVAVVAQSDVANTAAVALAVVAADEVVVEVIVVAAGAERNAASPTRQTGVVGLLKPSLLVILL